MKTQQALGIAEKIGELIHMSATFQAQYGCTGGNLKATSKEGAWALYHAINSKQVEISQLIDTDALEKPHHTVNGAWWNRCDVPDVAVSHAMMQEAANLISACAYFEAQPHGGERSYNAFCLQSMIAGLLHPSAVQQALAEREHAHPIAG